MKNPGIPGKRMATKATHMTEEGGMSQEACQETNVNHIHQRRGNSLDMLQNGDGTKDYASFTIPKDVNSAWIIVHTQLRQT